jgi:hypothetical protein
MNINITILTHNVKIEKLWKVVAKETGALTNTEYNVIKNSIFHHYKQLLNTVTTLLLIYFK